MVAEHVVFVVLLVGTQGFFTGLAALNLRYGERTVDAEREWVREKLGVEDPDELLAYNRTTTGVSHLQSWVVLGFALLALYSGLFADAVGVVQSLGVGMLAEGVVFVLGVVVALFVVGLPFDVVETFVVEEIFDFNQQTIRLWVRDAAIQLAITVVLTAMLSAALLWVIGQLPSLWWLAGVGLFVAFSLVMQIVYPRVIAPLFNDFVPVEESDLRDAVDDVFERAGFTCEQVYEMDASKRSSHSNAYFIGFGRTKRVVLFDTLVDQMSLEEVQGVLAHELAHWKKAHVWKFLAAGAVQIAIVLFAFQFLMGTDWLYAMFGVPETPYSGLVLAALWVQPVNRLVSPIENQLSLAFEREADSFAVDVMGSGEPMVGALSKLASENLSNPFPHPWYAAFHYTHPPIPDRIRYIREQSGASVDDDPSVEPTSDGG